jgi:hypothetical protein
MEHSYSLDQNNVKVFLEKITNPMTKQAIQILLNNTTHVSYEQFANIIQSNISDVVKMLPPDRKIMFAYGDTKIDEFYYKSNYWIFKMIKGYLQEYDVKLYFTYDLSNNRIRDNDIVMLIDDCIYSGIQMAKYVSNIKNNESKQLNILQFIPYMSKAGEKLVKDAFHKNAAFSKCTLKKLANYKVIVPYSCYATDEEAESISSYYAHLTTKIVLEAYPIYFDHKVAKYMSSFPTVYSGIIPNLHNQGVILEITNLYEELDKYDLLRFAKEQGEARTDIPYSFDTINNALNEIKQLIKDNEKELEIIPLLNNCQKVIAPDLYDSSCPVPPYKKVKNKALESIFRTSTKSPKNTKSHYSLPITNKSFQKLEKKYLSNPMKDLTLETTKTSSTRSHYSLPITNKSFQKLEKNYNISLEPKK